MVNWIGSWKIKIGNYEFINTLDLGRDTFNYGTVENVHYHQYINFL